jgi:hypothetical protein
LLGGLLLPEVLFQLLLRETLKLLEGSCFSNECAFLIAAYASVITRIRLMRSIGW